jgi:hypothetical protein
MIVESSSKNPHRRSHRDGTAFSSDMQPTSRRAAIIGGISQTQVRVS